MEIAGTDLRQVAKFAVVGVINTAVDIAIFSALVFLLDWGLIAANTVAFCAAVINSYALNALWTFRGNHGARKPLTRLNLFILVSVVGLAISNLMVWLFADALGAIGAKLVAVVASFVWNFGASRKFVFTAKV